MDIKEIKQLIDLMKRYELTEFELEEQAFKVRLRRNPKAVQPGQAGSSPAFLVETPSGLGVGTPTPAAPALPANGGGSAAPTPTPFPAHHSGAPLVEEPGTQFIKSPMVGTFYRAANPDSKSFAEEGAAVQAETVVCIIEAMKMMNEIQAEVKGTILQILVENGKPVEFGQPLFKVKLG